MMTIPCVTVPTDDGPVLVPAMDFPEKVLAIVCDGVNYTVYEPGDTLPPPPVVS